MTHLPTAIVFGAYGDIGRTLCERLLEQGLRVVGCDIKAQPTTLAGVQWVSVDFSEGEMPSDVAETLGRLHPLNFVFHIVGGSDPEELGAGEPAHIPMPVIRRTLNLNLVSAFAVIDATADAMAATDGDRSYTFVSSTNAFGGYGAPAYSAAKAGLHGMVRALAEPLGRRGIRANVVALGTTQTENFERLGRELGRPVDFEALGRQVPRGRVSSAEEVAQTLIALGMESPNVSGAVLVADAAQSLVRRKSAPPEK